MAYPRPGTWLSPAAARDFADLGVVILLVLATDAMVLAGVSLPALRLPLVLSFMFLLPGYTWMAAIRPEHPGYSRLLASRPVTDGTPEADGIGLAERIVLSVGTSVGIIAIIGLALYALGIGVTPGPALAAVTATTLLGGVLATVRRRRSPPKSRLGAEGFVRPLRSLRGLFSLKSATDAVITLLLLVSLVAIASGTFSVAASLDDRGTYTEFYLLSTDVGKEPVAGMYPTGDGADRGRSLLLGIENHEGESRTYTVVVQAVVPEDDGVEPRRDELDRYHVSLGANQTRTTEYTIPVGAGGAGAPTRLTFLLYVGPAPEEPSRETAYRSVHLWLESSPTPSPADA